MEKMTFNYNGKAMSLRVYGYEREAYRIEARKMGATNVEFKA